jgi:hypothetical protein
MPEGSSPLTFRDSIRHLLPTAAAVSLFVPLWSDDKLEVGSLVFACVLLGYVITTPLTKFLGWLYRFTPAVRALGDRRQWIAANWDFGELFLNRLSQEEKEYTYLTGAYLDFYRQLAFYLLIYTSTNVFILAQAIITDQNHAGPWQTILSATTPVVGGSRISTTLLIIVSAVVGVYCFWDFMNEYVSLFLEGGIYTKFAEKSQKKEGGLAISVWGVAQHQKKGAPGLAIELKDSAGKSLRSAKSSVEGLFQFEEQFKVISAAGGTVSTSFNGATIAETLSAGANSIPSVVLELPEFQLSKNPSGWIAFLISAGLLVGVWIQCCLVLDAISMMSLLASLPFIVFLAVFVIGHRGLFEDWKLSASLLAGALLAATELSCLLRNLAYPASSNTHVPSAMVVASTLGSYRCVPPCLLVVVFFLISKLRIELKIAGNTPPTSSRKDPEKDQKLKSEKN